MCNLSIDTVKTIFLILVFLSGCNKEAETGKFVLIPQSKTGIDFGNFLFENDTINGNTFEYIYNGAGVGVADFNNDGLQDIYFAGNMVSSRLYLNEANFSFKDVTSASNTMTTQWCTGVTIVDINGDGLKDLYISVAGYDTINNSRENICFVNQGIDQSGIPIFKNMAREMGINDDGYSTMGVFFDYDKDQDLDLFLLTNSMDGTMRNVIREIRSDGNGESTDRLYRNNGNDTFENVSRESGIVFEGYGLGVGLSDINQDGWLDIYCANDFISNDLLYINNQDGTFSEQSASYFRHFTHNGMGMDIGDINNDALPDVMVLDMLPKENERQKLMIASNTMTFNESISSGYHPQFLRNTLQLNRGKFPDGQYRFSEISFLSGVYETDWSWAPLIADFDLDGWKDLLVTNGFRKDVTNLDYIERIIEISRFGTREAQRILTKKELETLAEVKLSNFIYKNNGDLTFSDVSKEWGLSETTFTNGTAYADFDNDGDLDLVMNNLDQIAMLYENRGANNGEKPNKNHYINIVFGDQVRDVDKIGLKANLYTGGQHQFVEYNPFRGYKSTMGEGIYFGMGLNLTADSLVIVWQDGIVDCFYNVPADSLFVLAKRTASQKGCVEKKGNEPEVVFWKNDFIQGEAPKTANAILEDLKITATLLHSLSNYGPSLSVGDINDDGLEDIYVGGEDGKSPSFLIQDQDGKFAEEIFEASGVFHDMGSLLFDADDDNDLDLYIVSGGYRWSKGHQNYQDRLYVNDGKGQFEIDEKALPAIGSSGSCVIAADYDRDGDLDLFVGGRVEGSNYPMIPQSYLLENRKGIFIDKSSLLGTSKGKLGMVTSALWTDVNNDGQIDIIVVGEWMQVTVLINESGSFFDKSESYNTEDLTGWWNSINGADLDNDGDMDYLVGNYGFNSFYKASSKKPLEMYASDFDKNGSIDPVIFHYLNNEKYIVHPFSVLRAQVPGIKNRFKTHSDYGRSTFKYSFTEDEIGSALYFSCRTMETIVLENVEGRAFRAHALPIQVQFSPVFGSHISDINHDGLKDILLVGNSMHEETTFGNYDASFGSVLLNRGEFRWDYLEPSESNFIAEGDKKSMVKVHLADGGYSFFVGENGGSLQSWSVNEMSGGNRLTLETDDWQVVYELNGQKSMMEAYYGEGFLSSSTRSVQIPVGVANVEIYKYNGERRSIALSSPLVKK